MKKKIVIGSIFAVLLMLSMPVITNIQAEENDCSICSSKIKTPSGRPICEYLKEEWLEIYEDFGMKPIRTMIKLIRPSIKMLIFGCIRYYKNNP